MSTKPDSKMCTPSAHADHDLQKSTCNNMQKQETHEKDFFNLFDFAADSASNNIGSSIRTIQGAASTVFGGIWSALDTAIAILNEDMESSVDDIFPGDAEEDEAHEYDSVMDVKFDLVQGDAVENNSFAFTSQSFDSVKSNGHVEKVPCLKSKELATGPNASNIKSNEVDKSSSRCPIAASRISPTMVPCSFDNSNSIAITRESVEYATLNDQNVESEYYIIPNKSHKCETDGGWLVVSED